MDAAVYCTAKHLAVKWSFSTVGPLIDVRRSNKNNNALVMMMTQIVPEILTGLSAMFMTMTAMTLERLCFPRKGRALGRY